MGYKFQFVTLAGFHALNMSMFTLARGYAQAGMTAYSKLQQEEFAAQELGYRAVTHQRFVGTGYFDEIAQVVSAGIRRPRRWRVQRKRSNSTARCLRLTEQRLPVWKWFGTNSRASKRDKT